MVVSKLVKLEISHTVILPLMKLSAYSLLNVIIAYLDDVYPI